MVEPRARAEACTDRPFRAVLSQRYLAEEAAVSWGSQAEDHFHLEVFRLWLERCHRLVLEDLRELHVFVLDYADCLLLDGYTVVYVGKIMGGDGADPLSTGFFGRCGGVPQAHSPLLVV